jgi:glycosyltransferase involved in cell wall biosynthesis
VKDEQVTLVIPGRNCEATIGECLSAIVPLQTRDGSRLGEIIFVDDGSTDGTAETVSAFSVRRIDGGGRGPGAARNLGWRSAEHPLVWFVDSDCVAEGDPLSPLLRHLDDPRVGAVSGSYGNMRPDSLLACLIHEEIVERHLTMPTNVNFLATFNVIYRKRVLEEVGGFNEKYLKAQDAELSFRVMEAGHHLHFDVSSKVKHYHPCRWLRYFSTQRQQGYWRVFLHMNHKGHAVGSHYSGLIDHVQPPLAMLVLVSTPLIAFPGVWVAPAGLLGLMMVLQIPMTMRIVRRTGRIRYFAFAVMSSLRAIWRGVGMTMGVLDYVRTSGRGL